MPSGGKRQLISGEGSITQISNGLRPQDPGGGVRLNGPRSDRCVLPVDMDGRGSGSEGLDCFPLPQGLAQQPVPRLDDDRPTRQFGRPPVETVKVSAVLVDVTLDLVDIPAPAGESGDTSPFIQQAAWADLDFCDSMVGGPTFAFLDGAEGSVDLAGDAAIGVVSSAIAEVASSADLAGAASSVVAEVASSAVAEVVSSADAETASSADLAGEAPSADLAGVASSAIAEVVSSAIAVRWRPWPLLRGVLGRC